MKKTIPILILLLASLEMSVLHVNFTIAEDQTRVFIDPPNIVNPSLGPDSAFTIFAKVSMVSNLNTWQIKILFNASILECVNGYLPPGNIFEGKTPIVPGPLIDNSFGSVQFGASLLLQSVNVEMGVLGAVDFRVKSRGTSNLELVSEETFLLDLDLRDIPRAIEGGFFDNRLEEIVHDIAVEDVTPSATDVTLGESISINVKVANQGTVSEDFSVTTFFDSSTVGTQGISLDPNEIVTLIFNWEPSFTGTFTLKATAGPVTGETDIEDNTRVDSTVTVTSPTPPPPTGRAIVYWANLTDPPYGQRPLGNPQYPFGGKYHNGTYPVWKNFTIVNDANENVVYITVKYPDTTPKFKPSEYQIRTFPDDQCWIIKVNTEMRTVEFESKGPGVRARGGCALVSIEFIEGPTEEDCDTGKEFAVTVSGITCYAETFYLREYIDKTPPTAEVTFPNAPTPGGQGYAFVKKRDGSIWVLMPNCTDSNIGWLWINGTASDACSGINRVEIWINGTYMGDAKLSGPVGSNRVFWSWHIDPSKDSEFWKTESWCYVVARAYDNSVNNEDLAAGHPNLPRTNHMDAITKWFFWIGREGPEVVACLDHESIDWVPGNGRLDVWGKTGFYPNTDVEIWLENELYAVKQLLRTVTTDNYGRFYVTIQHLPEVPRKPNCEDRWVINATSAKGNLFGADSFHIIPWITYENTLAQSDSTTWKTTMTGHFEDAVMVHGHGFLPSRQSKWDPYSTVYVQIYYTDVAPWQSWETRSVFNGTSQRNWDNLKWSPRLSEKMLARVTTDANGYWSAQIEIPQSCGGLHAIYAREVDFVTDLNMPGPATPELVRSGWPQCIGLEKEEQAVIFDMWPTLKISPSTALADQYVMITAEGLPLPRHYRLWKNNEPVVALRDWCMVLDFGPYKEWVFENKRIRNNELDMAWVEEAWFPFAFYTPDIGDYPESPVWAGKLTSITRDFPIQKWQFHVGSKFLKVPMIPAGNYNVTLYYFDKATETFVHDHQATTMVPVLKDPLHINVQVGSIHLPGEVVSVFAQVDVDGMAADATTLSLELYKGETLIQSLSAKNTGTGSYVASFTCPSGDGDYFVKASASKDYESFTLYGSAVAGFTVNPTLNGINARIVSLEGKVATVISEVGQMKIDLAAIGARVTSIDGKVATVESDIGTLKTDTASINAVIVGLHDDVATIHTAIGDLNTTIKQLNGIVTIENDVATIKTELGEIKGKVISLEGKAATIQTDIGTVKTNADSIAGTVGLQPMAIGLSAIAALAAIVAAALILRKVYIK